MAIKSKLQALLRGVGWTALTTASGLLGVLAVWIRSLISNKVDFDIEGLIASGSLLLFSATLAAAVAVDCFLQAGKGHEGQHFLSGIYLGSIAIMLFSALCYPNFLDLELSDVDLEHVTMLTAADFFSAIAMAIYAKTITLSGDTCDA